MPFLKSHHIVFYQYWPTTLKAGEIDGTGILRGIVVGDIPHPYSTTFPKPQAL